MCPVCGAALCLDMRARPAGFRARGGGGSSKLGTTDGRGKGRCRVWGVDAETLPTSSKVEAVIDEVQKMRKGDGMSKAVIFSQFTRMLDLLSLRLGQSGVRAARISGEMTREERDANLKVVMLVVAVFVRD